MFIILTMKCIHLNLRHINLFKTCDKTQVENKSCTTDKCEKNEDCFSGLCYSNICITDKMIYVCNSVSTGIEEAPKISCVKQEGIKCDNNIECNGICEVGFCKNLKSGSVENLGNTVLIFIIIAIVIVIILIGIIYISKRHKKW